MVPHVVALWPTLLATVAVVPRLFLPDLFGTTLRLTLVFGIHAEVFYTSLDHS